MSLQRFLPTAPRSPLTSISYNYLHSIIYISAMSYYFLTKIHTTFLLRDKLIFVYQASVACKAILRRTQVCISFFNFENLRDRERTKMFLCNCTSLYAIETGGKNTRHPHSNKNEELLAQTYKPTKEKPKQRKRFSLQVCNKRRSKTVLNLKTSGIFGSSLRSFSYVSFLNLYFLSVAFTCVKKFHLLINNDMQL